MNAFLALVMVAGLISLVFCDLSDLAFALVSGCVAVLAALLLMVLE